MSVPTDGTGVDSRDAQTAGSVVWVLFQPLDVVTFRDGRSFTAGTTASARTTLPRPTSTGGALTAVFGDRPDRIAGPVLASVDPDGARLVLPVPADLVVDRDGLPHRLHPDMPVDLPAGVAVSCDLDASGVGATFRLLGGGGKPAPGALGGDAVAGYLRGEPERALAAVAAAEPAALVRERRLGLARHSRGAADGRGRTAVTGFLYVGEFWRARADAEARLGFACRVWFDRAAPTPVARIVRLGGEGRQARVRVLPDATVDPPAGQAGPSSAVGTGVAVGDGTSGGRSPALAVPDRPDGFPGGQVLLYLATPAVFPDGWLPAGIDGADLVAACTAGPEAVAGWAPDPDGPPGGGRPRPVRWAVGAGSVYFLRFGDEDAARVFARRFHGRCLPQAQDWLRTVGFGMCLVGVW